MVDGYRLSHFRQLNDPILFGRFVTGPLFASKLELGRPKEFRGHIGQDFIFRATQDVVSRGLAKRFEVHAIAQVSWREKFKDAYQILY